MLRGLDIVYVGNDWFTENKTSSHHIAEELAKFNRILYVEGAGQRTPSLSGRDIGKIIRKIGSIFSGYRRVKENLYVCAPLVLPFNMYRTVRAVNGVLLTHNLRKYCRKLEFKSPLLWMVVPHFVSLVGKLQERGVVYYCVDEYSAQQGANKKSIKDMEESLLTKANVVFAVSEPLLEKKRILNPNTYLSLHGVDVGHFGKAIERECSIPEDIRGIPRPIAGFFGVIQPRVDLQLIRYIAERRPDLSLVLIGLVSQDISLVKECRNVFFLGPKPYDSLPNYLKAFDVAMMPYRLNDEMINSNPKKTREYLAGGKPVVSVRIREVERYGNLVYIAEGYEEFLMCIENALNNECEEKIRARIKATSNESWAKRVEDICLKVQKHIRL